MRGRGRTLAGLAAALTLAGCAGWQGCEDGQGWQPAPDMTVPFPALGGYAGGLRPSNIGGMLDTRARAEAESAVALALGSARDTRWASPNAGGSGGPARGRVSVSAEHPAFPCREFVHLVKVGGGAVSELRGLACRTAEGDWIDAWPVGDAVSGPPGQWPGCFHVKLEGRVVGWR